MRSASRSGLTIIMRRILSFGRYAKDSGAVAQSVRCSMATEGEGPRVIADVSSYEQMLAALRARVNELQINGERFDEYAGLPRGYLSKLVGAKPIRRLGMVSFEPVLAALGLRLLVIEDNAATERLKNKLPPRNQSYVRSIAVHT